MKKLAPFISPRIFWDLWADEFIKDKWQHQYHEQHKVISKIVNKIPKSSSILDVGCGFGRNIGFLIEQGFDPKRITGIDFSAKLLQTAKKTYEPLGVNFYKADITKPKSLPFSNKTFDLILLHGVLMHINPSQLKKALTEVIRVAKKDLIIIEQNYPADNSYTYLHDYSRLLKKYAVQLHRKLESVDVFYVKVR